MLIKVPSFNCSVVAGIITVNRFTARNMENFINTKTWGFRQLLVKLFHTESTETS